MLNLEATTALSERFLDLTNPSSTHWMYLDIKITGEENISRPGGDASYLKSKL